MRKKITVVGAGNVGATLVQRLAEMELGDFQETGIPLIFDAHGNGVDLQHRILAQIITDLTVTHYVVNLRKDVPSIFAYYDQGKPRTHSEILKVAGYGEISGTLASAINAAHSNQTQVRRNAAGEKNKKAASMVSANISWPENVIQ